MSTVFHEFDQSGWWPFSASSATRVMNANASEKSANWKRRRKRAALLPGIVYSMGRHYERLHATRCDR